MEQGIFAWSCWQSWYRCTFEYTGLWCKPLKKNWINPILAIKEIFEIFDLAASAFAFIILIIEQWIILHYFIKIKGSRDILFYTKRKLLLYNLYILTYILMYYTYFNYYWIYRLYYRRYKVNICKNTNLAFICV